MSDSPPASQVGSGPHLSTTFVQLLLPAAALHLYWLGLNLTKPSPLARTSEWQLMVVGSYAVLGVAVATLVFSILAHGVDRVSSRLGRSPRAGTNVAIAVLTATLLLVFIDNLLHSAVGASLRTEDGSPIKLAFLLVAIPLGVLWARRSIPVSRRISRRVIGGCVILAVVATALVGRYLNDELAPPTPPSAQPRPPLNVVILSSDGINADEMSVYSGRGATTPFLESISGDLMVFNNAFANNGNTTGSIVSLLTGRSPLETGVVYPPDALQQQDARRSLPYILGELGYRRTNWATAHYADAQAQNLVDAFDLNNGRELSALSQMPLGSGPARWVIEGLFEAATGSWADALWVSEMDNPYGIITASSTNKTGDQVRLEGIIREIERHNRFFINSHFLVTHGPRFPLPPETSIKPQSEEWQRTHYRRAIRVFDEYVREVFMVLRAERKLESTIVIITSDHGQKYDARQRVPLLIRFPDARHAGRYDVNVQRLDVAPTVLTALGREIPEFMTGRDLSAPDLIDHDREIVASTISQRSHFGNLGVRPDASDVLITRVACQRYEQKMGGEVVATGTVPGSSASCPR